MTNYEGEDEVEIETEPEDSDFTKECLPKNWACKIFNYLKRSLQWNKIRLQERKGWLIFLLFSIGILM